MRPSRLGRKRGGGQSCATRSDAKRRLGGWHVARRGPHIEERSAPQQHSEAGRCQAPTDAWQTVIPPHEARQSRTPKAGPLPDAHRPVPGWTPYIAPWRTIRNSVLTRAASAPLRAVAVGSFGVGVSSAAGPGIGGPGFKTSRGAKEGGGGVFHCAEIASSSTGHSTAWGRASMPSREQRNRHRLPAMVRVPMERLRGPPNRTAPATNPAAMVWTDEVATAETRRTTTMIRTTSRDQHTQSTKGRKSWRPTPRSSRPVRRPASAIATVSMGSHSPHRRTTSPAAAAAR